jgi:hypothetical protein
MNILSYNVKYLSTVFMKGQLITYHLSLISYSYRAANYFS